MAEQSNVLDPLLNLSRVMTSLKSMTEPKGVSASITRDDVREKDRLSPNEEYRLKQSATIIGKILKIGAFKEGPEATRLGDFTANAEKLKTVPTAIRDKVKVAKSGDESSALDDLMELLGLSSVSDMLKTAKTWLIDKLQRFIITPFKNFIKWMGGKIWRAIKWMGGKIWQGVKWLGTKISNMVSSLVSKIKNSRFYKGMMSTVGRAATGIKNLWDDALKGIKGFVDNLVKGITSLKDGALELVKKIPGYDLVKKGIERTAQAGRAVGSAVGRAGSAVGGAVRGAADDVVKAAVSAGKGQITKFLGSFLGKGVSFIGSALKSIPILSSAIEAVFAKGDIDGFKSEYSQGKITLDELQTKIGRRVVTAISGVGGGALGAAVGTLLGPGVGTILGGVGGDILGRWLGGLFVDKIMSPDMVKKLGSFFQGDDLGLSKVPGEMQDFIVRNGQVYKFNTKDEVLGMKTGGAIDNLMTGLTQGLARDNSVIRDASIAQVNKLDELVYLMTELLKKPVSSSIIPIGSNSKQIFSTSETRSKYNHHTLITP